MSSPRLPVATTHRLAPLKMKPEGSLLIHEIYRSLQGESTWMGLPCTFVRLTACHLRCAYCDTPHAFGEGEALSLPSVIEKTLGTGDQLIEVTGGEPLLQPEVHPLMSRLADEGRTVLLETSGALDTSEVDPRVHIILDVKTPGSGESASNLLSNLDRIRPTDELKFVICDETDFTWSVDLIRQHRLSDRCPVLISPAEGRLDLAALASWILRENLPLRLQIQLHKIIWGSKTRGV